MTVYFIIYGLILISPQFIVRQQTGDLQEYQYDKHIIFMMGLLILMLALRHQSMGVDLGYGSSYGYLGSFIRLSQYSWREIIKLPSYLNYEKGYILFNKAISVISKDPQWLLICCGFVSLVPIGVLIYRYSNDSRFSVFVFMTLPCFQIFYSGLRQGIAIGICCYAMCCLQERKKWRFILSVILACLFHSSAFIFLLAYPLYYLRVEKKTRFISILLLPVVFIFSKPLFVIFSRLFKENAAISNTGAGTLSFILAMIYCFCSVFVDETDEKSVGFLNVFYFACICQSFSGLHQLAMRAGYYFMMGLVIALPNIVSNIEDDNSYLIFHVGVQSAFVAYGLYAIHASSWSCAYPYHFFWEAI